MITQDLRLIKKLKNEDPKGFRELFDLYYTPLSIYALKYCDSFELAEDIVQDLFVKIWDEKIYLQFKDSIGPYLFKATKNNTLKAIRNESKYRFDNIENHVNELKMYEEMDVDTLSKEKAKLMQRVESLPEKGKEVFKSIVFDGKKYKEVALSMDVSVNTVKTHYKRALKNLRNSIDFIVFLLLI